MLNKEISLKLSKSIFRAIFITFIMLVVYGIFMTIVETSTKVNAVVYLVVSMLGILYGAIYASKIIGKKGWLCGAGVAIGYMIILMVVFIALNKDSEIFNKVTFYKVAIATAVGALGGMLGINL